MCLLLVSPHLDDAALSCGSLLAANPGSVVVTVMAGVPSPRPLSDWDRLCGFVDGDDVVALRRKEDEAALRILDARPVWLSFLDDQYEALMDGTAIADKIERISASLQREVASSGCERVVSPLGIHHRDHVITALAALKVARRNPTMPWLVYDEAPYRNAAMFPGEQTQVLACVRAAGFQLDRASPNVEATEQRKRDAIACYASQLKGLGEQLVADAYNAETFWTVVRRPSQ